MRICRAGECDLIAHLRQDLGGRRQLLGAHRPGAPDRVADAVEMGLPQLIEQIAVFLRQLHPACHRGRVVADAGIHFLPDALRPMGTDLHADGDADHAADPPSNDGARRAASGHARSRAQRAAANGSGNAALPQACRMRWPNLRRDPGHFRLQLPDADDLGLFLRSQRLRLSVERVELPLLGNDRLGDRVTGGGLLHQPVVDVGSHHRGVGTEHGHVRDIPRHDGDMPHHRGMKPSPAVLNTRPPCFAAIPSITLRSVATSAVVRASSASVRAE